jgi:hypothetical protein
MPRTFRHLTPLRLALAGAAAALIALALTSPAAALPPAGTVFAEVSGQVNITSRLGQETIPLSGTATIVHNAPQMQGSVEVATMQITDLDLEGQSSTGTITVSERASPPSMGEMRTLQTPPPQFPASSFFDVFVDAVVPASPGGQMTLSNNSALRVVPMSGGNQVPLQSWPPDGVTYGATYNPCVPMKPVNPSNVCVTSISMTLSVPVGGLTELPDVAQPREGGVPWALVAAAVGLTSLAFARALRRRYA